MVVGLFGEFSGQHGSIRSWVTTSKLSLSRLSGSSPRLGIRQIYQEFLSLATVFGFPGQSLQGTPSGPVPGCHLGLAFKGAMSGVVGRLIVHFRGRLAAEAISSVWTFIISRIMFLEMMPRPTAVMRALRLSSVLKVPGGASNASITILRSSNAL